MGNNREGEETDLLLRKSSSSSELDQISKDVENGECNRAKIETEGKTADENGTTLIMAFLLMLLFSLANRVFGRLQMYPMHNYPLFINLLASWIYIPVCFLYIVPTVHFGNTITREQREIPKRKFAVMGGFDSVAGIMHTFAVNYISNASLIVLMQQSAIPISMFISKYNLNSTYSNTQYLGASIVLFGIVVVVIPNFFLPPSVSTTGSLPVAESTPFIQLLWLGVLVMSSIPKCMSSVYKEKALGEVDIDITYLNGWVAVFQFFIAIPLCIPTASVQNIPVYEIIPNLYGGVKCWMGINSVSLENNPYNLPLDDCSSAPFYVNTYLFFNIVYNFLLVVILKIGSSNILYLSSTAIVPLCNVVFSLKFIPGNQPLRTWDIIGLVVIMTGLVIYRFNKELILFLQTYFAISSRYQTIR
jgi:uncharacterized membrane protein